MAKQCASAAFFVLCAFIFCSMGASFTEKTASLDEEELTVPLGLPPIPWPEDNPYSAKKAELGRLLYFDKRLSSDGTVACATCHSIPDGFSDHDKVSTGIFGRQGTRHSPTVINSAYQKKLFWDGRASSLEEQAKGPIGNPKEMTSLEDIQEAHRQCCERINSIAGYRLLFKEAFGTEDCSIDMIAKAIATFERTVLSGNSPYDRYKAGDLNAMTEEQIAGYKTFKRVGCAICHAEPLFTDGRFANIGIGMDQPNPDLGRYNVTKNPRDWGSFKTPPLRDVEHTAPYMHDGSHATLEEVVEYYDRGGIPNKNLYPIMRKPLGMTDQEKQELVSFLKALNGEGWQHFREPETFPQ